MSPENIAININSVLAKSKIRHIPKKNINGKTLRNWASGESEPNADTLRAVCSYIMYGDNLAKISEKDYDINTIMSLEGDFKTSFIGNILGKYRSITQRKERKYFKYAIHADAILNEDHGEFGSPLGVVGVYSVEFAEGAYEVSDGEAYFVYEKQKAISIRKRGDWTSSSYSNTKNRIFINFMMHNDNPLFDAEEGGYEGHINMRQMRNINPILGSVAFLGNFFDLSEKRIKNYMGGIYAESIDRIYDKNQMLKDECLRFIELAGSTSRINVK